MNSYEVKYLLTVRLVLLAVEVLGRVISGLNNCYRCNLRPCYPISDNSKSLLTDDFVTYTNCL